MLIASTPPILNIGIIALLLIAALIALSIWNEGRLARKRADEAKRWPVRRLTVKEKRVELRVMGLRLWINQSWRFDRDGVYLSPEPPVDHRYAKFYVTYRDEDGQETEVRVTRRQFDSLRVDLAYGFHVGRYSSTPAHEPEVFVQVTA
jgi:hypothetical protein